MVTAFSFLRSAHIVLHNGSTNLHLHQHCWRILFSPYLLQHLSLIDFCDDGHSDRCEELSHFSFDLHFSYQIANICWIIEKVKEFQKKIYFCIDYDKAFDCVYYNKLWKILKKMEIPDHLTCLLRNLYAGQETTVRTGHGTIDWFRIGKGVCQGCILSSCLFNLHAECIMWNAGLDEAEAGIKMVGRNINNVRYTDDTTLMAESEEELKRLFLMKVKEESEKVCLKLYIQKTKIMASCPITSWQIDG